MNYKKLLLSYHAGAISKEALKDQLSSLAASEETFPLTEGQRGLWSVSKNNPESNAYHVPVCLRIRDDIDVGYIEQSCQHVVSQHPILMSKITTDSGRLAFSPAHEQMFSVGLIDLEDSEDDNCKSEIQNYIDQPFDLDEGPMLRAWLFSRNKKDHYLLFVAHHIAFDGMSAVNFVGQFIDCYHQLKSVGKVKIQNPMTGYQEFSHWEKNYLDQEEVVEHLEFWEAEYKAGMPNTELLGDISMSAGEGSDRISCTINCEEAKQVRNLCEQQNISQSTYFLTLFQSMLSRYTKDKSVVVGMPVMNRPQVRFDEIIGYCVNVLPVCARDIPGKSFSALAKDVSDRVFDIAEHAAYPFPKMVREMGFRPDSDHAPVFRIMYAYQNFLDPSSLSRHDSSDGAPFEFQIDDCFQQGTDYDLALEVCEKGEGFQLSLKYSTSKYSRDYADKVLAALQSLNQELIQSGGAKSLANGEKSQDVVFSELDQGRSKGVSPTTAIQSRSESGVEEALLESSYGSVTCIHDIFSKKVKMIPEKVGLISDGKKYTYAEIDAITDALAVRLVKKGVQSETVVGICMDRSADVLFAVLSILKSGGTYVPLDPSHPEQRLAYVLEDCQPKLIIADKRYLGKLNAIKTTGDSVRDITISALAAEEYSAGRNADVKEALIARTTPNSLAYILYTSGSTGDPKGVMVEHKSVLNTLFAMEARYPVTDDSCYLLKTNYIFDVSVTELFGWFIGCGTLVVLPEGEESEPDKLLEAIVDQAITHVNFVPSMLTSFLCSISAESLRNAKQLRHVFVAGEAFTAPLMRLCHELFPARVEIENIYGPTEVSIYASWFSLSSVDAAAEFIPIGKPLPNVETWILGSDGEPVEEGTAGELCVSGAGVARGYWNKPELTKQKFLADPLRAGSLLYKTGDLVSRLPDGNIKYLGRIDDQVKIRGYRIEIGAIESCLQDHPAIKQCAVVVNESAHNKQLVGYFVEGRIPENTDKLTRESLKDFVGKFLPEYMIPSFYVPLEQIPLTSTGKVDRKNLASRTVDIRKQSLPSDVVSFEKGTIERELAELWERVLNVKNIGMTDGFFDVGGDSINLTMMIKSVNEKYRCKLDRSDVFEFSDIRSLASHIIKTRSDRERPKPVHKAQTTPVASHQNVVPMIVEPVIDSDQSNENPESEKTPKFYKNCLAIVGMSGAFPGADNTDEFWSNLLAGKESVRILTKVELAAAGFSNQLIENPNYVPVESAINNKAGFDPEFFNITPKDAELMDPQYRHLLMHSWAAIEDSGYSVTDVSNTGVFVSAGMSFYQALTKPESTGEDAKALELNAYSSWVLSQSGTAPTMISHKLGLNGPSMFVHTNCSSSLIALDSAVKSILSGDCEQALVGAASVLAHDVPGYIHQQGMNFSSDGHLRAFDENADGMIAGEGVAVIMLKRADKAIADGDNVYAVIRGIAINNDGSDKVGYYAPGYRGQVDVIANCLRKTAIDPTSIEYVEAHGTGTKLGDPVEVKAISDVYRGFGSKTQFCGMGSVKSNIGHLDSAAGLASLVKVSLALKNRTIPPTINCEQPNSEIPFDRSPFFLVKKTTPFCPNRPVSRAALSSFGLGGTNTHAILESLPEALVRKTASAAEGVRYIVPISAKTHNQLTLVASRLLSFLCDDSRSLPDIQDLSYTLQLGRLQMPCRACFVAASHDELCKLLTQYLADGDATAIYVSEEMPTGKGAGAFYEEDDAKLLFGEWCKNGQLEKLAKMWVTGVQFEWQPLWLHLAKDIKPVKVSLPTYPFLMTDYWLGDKRATSKANSCSGKQPLVSSAGYRHTEAIDNTAEECSQQPVYDAVKEAHIQQDRCVTETDSASKEPELQSKQANTDTNSMVTERREGAPINDDVLESILTSLAAATGIEAENIDVDADLIEMGLDSLAFLGVVKDVKDLYAIEISQSQLFDELSSLKRIATYVESSLNLLAGNGADNEQIVADEKSVEKPTDSNEPVLAKPISSSGKNNENEQPIVGYSDITDASLEFNTSYIQRTETSRRMADNNRPYMADSRAVAGLRPATKGLVYPIVGDEAEGAYFSDIDGNHYMDVSMGFGVLLFGHKPPFVEKALVQQVNKGLQIGPQSQLAGEVAKLMCELTGVDRVAFCNTGSEAVMVALRIARAATGRQLIAVFRNSYHGHFDGVLPGMSTISGESDLLELDYNDEKSLVVLAERSAEIAGVIVEPVQSRRPELQPKEFLKQLRSLTLEKSIPLIFDEVLTGFRIMAGGAQEYFGVRADIVTYGKIIGGGLPVAAVGGLAQYMDYIDGGQWSYDDDSFPSSNRIMFVGTYNKNSLAMAASHAVLSHIKAHGKSLYPKLNTLAKNFYDDLNRQLAALCLPLEVVSFGSLFRFKSNRNLDVFFQHLIHSGVYIWEGRNCFISTEMDNNFLSELARRVVVAASSCFSTINEKTSTGLEKNSLGDLACKGQAIDTVVSRNYQTEEL